jgi:hypothetical protein
MKYRLRVALETGPKGKKVVAWAPDWPGLERGAKSEEAAVERLLAYVPRYAPVAKLAGMESELSNITGADVVETYPGTGSTDFWAISFAYSSIDQQAVSSEELERELTLLRACWSFFDEVRSRVSAELQKGPRGGGRDRDRIVRHVIGNEWGWAKGLGVQTPLDEMLADETRVIIPPYPVEEYRDAYCDGIRALHSQGKTAGKWPLRYMIRHTAFHTLDHTWEMEDKDLTPLG